MKPKIYISARANSVQPEGRPESYQEHLIRVYNKESTPVAPASIVNQFGTKKNLNRRMLESYLVIWCYVY
jgi:hypothetical protein